MNPPARVRKPAAERRAEIINAADTEFAATGLAGTRLEAIAARVGISHPRIVQMFGSKHELFLEVVHAAFDRIEAVFQDTDPKTLRALGDGYRRLLQGEPTIGLVILQGYAAAADHAVKEAVRQRHLDLQQSVVRMTGADAMQVRTFFATGLIMTVSTVLDLPERRADTAWSSWILDLVDPADGGRPAEPCTGTAIG